MQPNAEMSSGQATFDLKAAREICSRIKGYEDPDGGNFADFQAAEMLPAALDEIERQAKRIAELEEALVEERARGNHYGMSYEDAAGGKIERWIIDGEIDAPKVYIERMRVEARAQLRREGKI